MSAKRFENLKVWEKAHQFVLKIYQLTGTFPKHELFGLTSQMRRAAISIPANIAEGFVKRTIPDKIRFFNISQGSVEETRYFLRLTNDLGYGDTLDLTNDLIEISKMLNSYIKTIRNASI